MNTYSWLQILIFMATLLLLAKPLGTYMATVYQNERLVSMNSTHRFLDRVLGPVERFLYRLSGIDSHSEMTWKTYAVAMLAFNILGLIAVYLLQRLQGVLPLIKQTIDAAHGKGKWVGMCGELAGMTKAIPILLGFGLDEFSMNPRAIPEAKYLIGKLTDERACEIANQAMSLGTAADIEHYMKGTLAGLA